MIRIGAYFIGFMCLTVLGLVFGALPTVALAGSEGRIWRIGEPSPGVPACDEFFDKWEVPGAPPGLLAMAGLGRELMAANDCIAKNDVPKACEHWTKLLAVMDKMGPPLDETRGDVEKLVAENKCQAKTPPPESNPAPAE